MGKENEGVKTNKSKVDKNTLLLRARTERGARIKSLREASGLTTEAFAKECGVSEVTQYHYEKGTRSPDADYLDRLYFERAVDLRELVTGVPRATSNHYDEQTRSVADRFQALPKSLRKTVDEVLLLAWLAHQDRKADHKPEPAPAGKKPVAKERKDA